jgi:hypothetical protein
MAVLSRLITSPAHGAGKSGCGNSVAVSVEMIKFVSLFSTAHCLGNHKSNCNSVAFRIISQKTIPEHVR